MRIATLFTNRIELVKEKHAWLRSNVIEELAQPGIGFPKIATNQCVITNHKKWQSKCLCNRFCKRCLAVARRAGQQHPMPWLVAVCAQNISSRMLLDQLLAALAHRQRQKQLIETNLRLDCDNGLAALLGNAAIRSG